jgi:hypothetical protein
VAPACVDGSWASQPACMEIHILCLVEDEACIMRIINRTPLIPFLCSCFLFSDLSSSPLLPYSD